MINVLRLRKQSLKKNKISKKGVAQKLSGGRSGANGSKLTKKVENGTNKEESRKNAQSRINARKSFDPTVGPAAKLKIKNLDLGVTVDDLIELFSEIGPLKGTYINKDRSGKSLGTANVYFEKKNHAIKAMKKYNGVTLDEKPMQVKP